ncbi:Hypothetical Protein FCC1311_108512 [Hondaea fermentalgiana]|uniref:Uncharacterized protein n=1 Tax=Hondaea fermentalgiana TaxID=2315210 RepID=A0A2R5GWB8_9STRA|nr:Hypothetical Protein FCC1311_108512 [Hondaea fermentalgiana]|eukprot:GBG34629.1 Hypothetical Protein FCC1311_108512 [Hondaea fermentalgiana]
MVDLAAAPGRGKNPTNRTDDIDGAQPRIRFAYANPDWKEDIEGSRPKPSKHTQVFNKPDLFNVRDIEGAKAKKSHFRTTRRVNPLDPEYKLPSFEPIVYETPRFIRDSFDVSDIEGTKSRVPRTFETRNSHDVSDIEGTSAAWAPWHATMIKKLRETYGSRKVDPLHVRDITEVGFQSKRVVNPLHPEYFIHGSDVRDCEHSTAPRKLFRETNTPFFSLHTKDIRGAEGGSGSVFQRLRSHERKVFRKTNEVSDIEGATTGTLRRGLRSKRQTDPLRPKYRFLHGAHTPTPPDETSRETYSTTKEDERDQPSANAPLRRSSNQDESQRDDPYVSINEDHHAAPDNAPPRPQSAKLQSESFRKEMDLEGRQSRSGNNSNESFRSRNSSGRSSKSTSSSIRSKATVHYRQEASRQAEISSVRDLPDFDDDL